MNAFLSEHRRRVTRAVAAFAQRFPLAAARGHLPGVTHRCGPGCRMMEEPAPPHGWAYVYICIESGHLHLCTSTLCRYTREFITHQSLDEAETVRVCVLTHRSYTSDLETEAVLTRVSYVTDPESRTLRTARILAEAARLEPNIEAQCVDNNAPVESVDTKPKVQRRAPRLRHGTDRSAVDLRDKAFGDALGALLPTGTPSATVARIRALLSGLWTLLQKGAPNFKAQSGRMPPPAFTVIVVYGLVNGLSLPRRGMQFTVLPRLDELRGRLPNIRQNGVVEMAQCTVARKAFTRCLSALQIEDVAAWKP